MLFSNLKYLNPTYRKMTQYKHVLISEETSKKLTAYCKANGRTKKALLTSIIEEYLVSKK
jgi:predicted DNA-binding protein